MKIYQYLDYRKYLRDTIEERKKEQSGFSFRYVALKLGCNAGFFNKVINGHRNLSQEHTLKLQSILKMDKQEGRYFEHLVQYNQGKTQLEKERHFEELQSFAGSEPYKVSKSQYAMYSSWYHAILRDLLNVVTIYDISEESAKILSKTLWPSIDEAEILQALQVLYDVGVIHHDYKGRIRPVNKLVTSGAEIPQVVVNKVLRQFFELGVQSLDRFTRTDRLCSSVSVSVNKNGLDKISEIIAQCRKDILATAASNRNSIDRVYHMNFQLFPVTKKLPGV